MNGDWERPNQDWDRARTRWEQAGRDWERPAAPPENPSASRASGGAYFRMGNNPAGPKLGAAVALIVIGVAFFLNNLGVLHVGSLWEFWPLLLIMAGLRQLYSACNENAYVRGFIEIGVGILFQLHNLGLFHFRIAVLWPVALIGAGILLLFRPGLARLAPMKRDIRNEVQEFSFFGGVKRVLTTREFRGGELLSVFGGIELNLRGADIAPGVTEVQIEANAAFGGIEIKVPDRWRVEVHGMGIFGGYEDKTMTAQHGMDPNAPVLIVRGFAAFGGVTVE